MADEKNLPSANLRPLSAIERIGIWYSSTPAARALAHAAPVLGPAMDALLEGSGTKLKEERVMAFIEELSRQVQALQTHPTAGDQAALQDLLLNVIERVARTRSADKRQRFARLVKMQLQQPASWEMVDVFARLLDDLSDLHVLILDIANKAPMVKSEAVANLKVIVIEKRRDDNATIPSLERLIPGVGVDAIRAMCAELVARGLLHDEGIGRWDMKPLELFVITTFGADFLHWVSE